jgi:predicted nicotinamide N-methyase
MMIPDKAEFIRNNTLLLPVPHVPELQLYVAAEVTGIWEKTEDDLEKLGLPPPFWAFAWAGGQGLARYVLDHPELVQGKRVLDFASGSGLVAIAALKAGASDVIANDIDGFAAEAIRLNAAANGVMPSILLADPIGSDDGWDTVLAGDICYDREMTARVMAWLRRVRARGADVVLGDPGRAYLPKGELDQLAEYRVPTSKAIEDGEIKHTKVYRLKA